MTPPFDWASWIVRMAFDETVLALAAHDGRVTATVTCPLCPFRVKHTDDTAREVGGFVAARMTEHVLNAHQAAMRHPLFSQL